MKTFEEWLNIALNGEIDVNPSLTMGTDRKGLHWIKYEIMSNAEDNILTPFVKGFLRFSEGDIYAAPSDETSNIPLINFVTFNTVKARNEYLEKIYLYDLRWENVEMNKMISIDIHIESTDKEVAMGVANSELLAFTKLANLEHFNSFKCDLKGDGIITIEVSK